jgi:glycosyltransferase involved in cell wall biosynthesis
VRVCIYGDLKEEKRLSMDICAQHIATALNHENVLEEVVEYTPLFQNFLSRFLPYRVSNKIDLLINRHLTYPLPKIPYTIHHIVDHSYAHLVHRLPREKTLVTCHDLNIYYRMVKSKNPLFVASCKHILTGLQKAKWIICDSEFTRQELLTYDLATNATSKVIPLGIASDFCPLPEVMIDATAHKYHLPSTPLLIHVGDCFERKNIENLLSILAKINERMPVTLLKVGGVFTPHQQQRITQLNLQEQIIHLSQVPFTDLIALYNLAKLCVFPSWLEGFGFPVLEAMACGTPVVATNRSSVPELVSDAGFLIDPADIEGYTHAIERLLSDAQLYSEYRNRGLARVKDFSWQRHAQATLAFYQNMVASA